MEFHELARNRYSCRKYRDEKPSAELISDVLSSAQIAPSAKNLQPWKFIVVDDPEVLQGIQSCYGRDWIKSAPVVIAVCGDHGAAWIRDDAKDHTDIDVAIATDHLTLAATDHGLATCWICKFDAVKAAGILRVMPPWEVIALIPIGFPADKPDPDRHERQRKSLSEIVSYNSFE